MILKTLDNAIQVLNCFTKEKQAWGVRELARELDMSHTAINRILKTYEKNGLLRQNTETQKYYLGLKFLEFSQLIGEVTSITEDILPMMKQIMGKTKESVYLTWKENYEGVTLAIAESEERIKFSVSVGSRTPLYAGASCKVMMAFLLEEEQQEIIETGLKRFTTNTVLDEDVLMEQLEDIKAKGWSYTCGEYSNQVFGLGVPLFDRTGNAVASITIAGPEYRLTEQKKEEMIQILLEDTKEIQQMIANFYL
ncbi:MAG TPA: IclR family transcriptional regulator [Pseudogracilibacillus sp.]|nr:IclR family transcriptional regulator [Pseudogracilibacillus sp.]